MGYKFKIGDFVTVIDGVVKGLILRLRPQSEKLYEVQILTSGEASIYMDHKKYHVAPGQNIISLKRSLNLL